MTLRAVIAVCVAAGVGAAEIKLGKIEQFSDATCTTANLMDATEYVLDKCIVEGDSSFKVTCAGTTLTKTTYSDKACTASPSASALSSCTQMQKGTCGITYTPAAADSQITSMSMYEGGKCDAGNLTMTVYKDQGSCEADDSNPGVYSWHKCVGGKPWVEMYSDKCTTMFARKEVSKCMSMFDIMSAQTSCMAKPAKYVKMTMFTDKCDGEIKMQIYLGDWCTKFGPASIKLSADNKATMYKDGKCGVVAETTAIADCGTCKEETENGQKSYTKVDCVGYSAAVSGGSSATLAASALALFAIFSFGSK